MTQWLMNPTRNHGVAGLIPSLAQWVEDLALPWAVVWVADMARIWRCGGCGVATDPIRPLAWEPPYASGAVPRKRQKDQKKKKE